LPRAKNILYLISDLKKAGPQGPLRFGKRRGPSGPLRFGKRSTFDYPTVFDQQPYYYFV
uniref:Ribosomal protein L18 n=1 Tax=Haemonchus placei TaxID=6290 RepID=A0A0N4WWU7_HAEPC